MDELSDQLTKANMCIELLANKLQATVRYSYDYNVLIHGLKESVDDISTIGEASLKILNKLVPPTMKKLVASDLEMIHHIGKIDPHKPDDIRAVVVKFYSRPKKRAILGAAKAKFDNMSEEEKESFDLPYVTWHIAPDVSKELEYFKLLKLSLFLFLEVYFKFTRVLI